MNTERAERLRKDWEEWILGTSFDQNTANGRQIILSLDTIADGDISNSKDDSSDVVYRSYGDHVRALAVAYRTIGTKRYKDPATKAEISAGLETIYQNEYNPDINSSNWWACEVGIPMRVFDVLILMYDEITDIHEQINRFCNVFLQHRDDYQKTSNGMKETGANLLWKSQNLLLCGILSEDDHLMDLAYEGICEVLKYSSTVKVPGQPLMYNDGFYPDGSFIQHYFFAYNGGYGKHLLNVLSGLLYAFHKEESLKLSTEQYAFIADVISKSYAPFFWNGHFMDAVRGRETSRYFYQDHICARHIARSLCYISQSLPGEYGDAVGTIVRQWLRNEAFRNGLFVDESPRAEYWVNPSLEEVLTQVESHKDAHKRSDIGHYNFGIISKPVHRTEKWAACVSMYSKNIACYEFLNGESHKFWHMSDGMLYLYAGKGNQFDEDYYAAVDMQRLPGTTVDRSPDRMNDSYYSWYLPESKNVYEIAGGAANGADGIAAMKYKGQGRGKERTLDVNKSWHFLGNEIICLGSGISSKTEDSIETILMNQAICDDSDEILTLNSEQYPCNKNLSLQREISGVTTIHLQMSESADENIGCVVLNGTELHALIENRTGTWNSDSINPSASITKRYCTVWLDHGTHPQNDSYAYVLLPGKTAEGTEEYADKLPFDIVCCTAEAHVVSYAMNGILSAVFFTAAEAGGITCDGPACILMKKVQGRTELSVSDPCKQGRVITLCLNHWIGSVETEQNRVKVVNADNGKFQIQTEGMDGESIRFSFIE